MKCTCGHPDNYNYAIDNGLCNSCIEAELERLRDALKEILITKATVCNCSPTDGVYACEIHHVIAEQALKEISHE